MEKKMRRKHSVRTRIKEYDNGNMAVIIRGLAGIRYEVVNPKQEVIWSRFVPFEIKDSTGRGIVFRLAQQLQDIHARQED